MRVAQDKSSNSSSEKDWWLQEKLPDWNQVISRCLVYWENEEKLHQLKYES